MLYFQHKGSEENKKVRALFQSECIFSRADVNYKLSLKAGGTNFSLCHVLNGNERVAKLNQAKEKGAVLFLKKQCENFFQRFVSRFCSVALRVIILASEE